MIAVWEQTSSQHFEFAAFGSYSDDEFALFPWQEDAAEPNGPS